MKLASWLRRVSSACAWLVASALALGFALSACSFPEYRDRLMLTTAQLCSDQTLDPTESDVDCGGPCTPCASGLRCRVGTDCDAGVCVSGFCAAPSCSDGAWNGIETDLDCGGICSPCADNKRCAAHTGEDDPASCQSRVCEAGTCRAPACPDGVLNGSETDLDCGGVGCMRCSDGKRCNQAEDCVGNNCSRGLCVPPHCTDASKDIDETDVDCGGTTCAACAAAQGCEKDADCTSSLCQASRCTQPSCDDERLNGDETDVDCGGSCKPCASGAGCLAAGDCSSSVCQQQLCAAPSCTDGVQNGTETDMNCGGSCQGCALGQSCLVGPDCASRACHDGACRTAVSLRYETTTTEDPVRNPRPALSVDNGSSDPIALSELSIRYYFTRDNAGTLQYDCYWLSFDPSCAPVHSRFVTLKNKSATADTFLELSFDPGPNYQIAAGASMGLTGTFHFVPQWLEVKQANDYSYDPTKDVTQQPWDKITVYRKGVLIWGVEPQP